jgi:hypothetical protein
MNYFHETLFQDSQLLNQLEEILQQNSTQNSYINELIIKKELNSLSETFKRIEGIDTCEEYQHEISVIFQTLRFIKEGYPDLIIKLNLNEQDIFGKRYDLMYESSKFAGELNNIKIALEIKFRGIQENIWPLNFEFLPSKNKTIKPLDELQYISKHLDKIISQYQQKISLILDGDPINRYCDNQKIKYSIIFIKKEINDLKLKESQNKKQLRNC